MKFNSLIKTVLLSLGLSFFQSFNAQEMSLPPIEMTVYKSPTCGCCQKWVDHINANEILSNVIESDDLSFVKKNYEIQGQYQSCHTGVVIQGGQDYIFEGHIPAEYIKAFLLNPPKGALGLSVPGMPAGSPGMEVGERKDYYQVLLLNEDGSNSVYAHVNQTQ